jgi:hypothetical protein
VLVIYKRDTRNRRCRNCVVAFGGVGLCAGRPVTDEWRDGGLDGVRSRMDPRGTDGILVHVGAAASSRSASADK